MLAATYLPLPTYPVIQENATPSDIGGAVLRYVISEGTTGTLTTRELELADIEGKRAVCGHGQKPGPELAHIQTARDIIVAALARRHAEEAAKAPAPVVVAPEPPQTLAEKAVEEAAEMTREQKIALLLEELLSEVGGVKRTDTRDPDDGMKARLKPVVPKLPPGAVGLQIQ